MKAFFLIILIFASGSFCQSQGNKKIVVSIADSVYFWENMEFVRKQKLTDLTRNNDSLFVRFTLTHTESGNKLFYELKKTRNEWKARFLMIGKAEYENYFFQWVIFNKTYQCISNKTKKLKYRKQLKSLPEVFFEFYFFNEMIDSSKNKQLYFQKIFDIKSIDEIDTSVFKPEVDSSIIYNMEIEISTPFAYKYIYWPAYYHIDYNGSYFQDEIQGDLFDLLYINKDMNIIKNYHKNRWPKR